MFCWITIKRCGHTFYINRWNKYTCDLEKLDWVKNHGTSDTMNMVMYAIKDRRTALAKQAKASISVGSTVGVNARTDYWLGTVTKVMKTRCAVKHNNNGLTYAVPMSLIDVKEAA